MIEDAWRYFAPGGAIMIGGPSSWYILDWDQRRIISVKMDEEQDSEDLAVSHLKKHVDTLAKDVVAIHVADDGGLLSTSSDIADNATTFVYFAPLQDLQAPEGVRTVLRSELRELDRLGPNVDLVASASAAASSVFDRPRSAEPTKLVFKYYFMVQFAFRIWLDLNVCMRLPRHPHIVHGRVVGFTTLYIPGGTLDDDKEAAPPRVIQLEWLRQLTRTVDDLYFKYGIAHQDIAARNLVVDPATNALLLFDFNWAGRIGDLHYDESRDDVKGVIFTFYELITRDSHFREVSHDKQNPDDVQGMDAWPQHPDVRLDHSVAEFRAVLDAWVVARREGPQITHYKQAAEYIDFPAIEPPEEDVELGGRTTRHRVWYRFPQKLRSDERVNWERPAQIELTPETYLLASGTLKGA